MYRHYYKGELVASSEMDRARKLTVWEVFETYADIRDDLEELLIDFQNTVEELGTAMIDLADGLGELETTLGQCDRTFQRFKLKYKDETELDRTVVGEEDKLPPGQAE